MEKKKNDSKVIRRALFQDRGSEKREGAEKRDFMEKRQRRRVIVLCSVPE